MSQGNCATNGKRYIETTSTVETAAEVKKESRKDGALDRTAGVAGGLVSICAAVDFHDFILLCVGKRTA